MVDLDLDGAKAHLVSMMTLNHAPRQAFCTVDNEMQSAAESLGLNKAWFSAVHTNVRSLCGMQLGDPYNREQSYTAT